MPKKPSRAIPAEAPWAGGLSRLLAERRGLKKGGVAERSGLKPGTISAVAKGLTFPHAETLQRIADAMTAYDREHNPLAPAVPLWEFFVSDEQADMLRSAAAAKAEAIKRQTEDPMLTLAKTLRDNPGLATAMTSLLNTAASTAASPSSPELPAPATADTKEHPPAADPSVARGRLHSRRKSA